MYHKFYQLKENPFNITADPEFFFLSKSHQEALSTLQYGIQERKGLLMVTGEVGSGKTTLCRKLLKLADNKTHFALVLNPNFSDLELLQMIVHDLGVCTKEKDKLSLIYSFNEFLLKEANKGHNVVVIIDEAQNLTVAQLEQIRLLSNLETEKEKLLQIILLGHPELYHKLQLPELRQVRQRISVHYELRHLEKKDVKYYIHHRISKALKQSRAARDIIFTEQAVETIYHYTQGSPRAINIVCDRALLAGFVSETFLIDEFIIENCSKEILCCEYNL